MKPASPALPSDPWPDWLNHGRHAGDPLHAAWLHERVEAYVDRLLDQARLVSGMTLLDVGSGDGVVAWRAIERTGTGLEVIVSDASAGMLAQARARAEALGVAGQCRFELAAADALAPIADASVDVVTTRSVLAYVADKRAALRAFHRVLRPGGRIALAEPVFQDDAFEANLLRHRLETQPAAAADPALRLMHRWKAAQFPDNLQAIAASALCSHSERDLLRMAQAEGYVHPHVQLDIRVQPLPSRSWDTFLDVTPHPWAMSLRTLMTQHCAAEERAWFERVLRPQVEAGLQTTTDRMAWLVAHRTEQ